MATSSKILPNIRLMARAFHRVPPSPSPSSTQLSNTAIRRLSTSSPAQKWEGSKLEDHITNEKDSHNVRYDAHREGQEERSRGDRSRGDRSRGDRSRGDRSRGTSEKAGEANKKAKEEFPEAPDTVGMQDERGGKS
ncbi:hypothetical protein BDZ45DRAFT_725700 [Acephala macrosclerotiorum]|nr:hypothetical protein BDZ45DRAFT_725700 [Acephala macrosclerotiorum]